MDKEVTRGQWWAPIVRTAAHNLVATAMFATIALSALAVGKLVHWMEDAGASPYSVAVLRFVEDAVVTMDAVAFLAFMAIITVRILRAALSEKD